MSRQHGQMVEHVFVASGELHVACAPSIISTVLGSCVSVCLLDELSGVAGLNHFMLPTRLADLRPADVPGRFGDQAVEALVEAMHSHGCRNLVAKVFGGAAVLSVSGGGVTVGEQNVAVALAQLKARCIPIVSGHLGGIAGLSIRLHTQTGEVRLQRLTQQWS